MRSALEEALSVLTEVMDPFLQEPHLSPHCAPLMGQRWPRRQPASPGSIFPCSLGGWSWAPACPLWPFSLAHLEVGAGHQRVLCGPLLHTVSPPCEMKILLPALPALEAFPVPGIFTRGSPWGPTPACVLGRCASSRASRDPCPEVQASGLWLSAPQVGPE